MSIVNFVNSETHEVSFSTDVMWYFINSLKYRPMEKFDYKQASIVPWHTAHGFHFIDPYTGEIMEFQVTALKSYNTLVACMIMVIQSDEKPHYYFIEWHGYSRTTSKQVSQWKNRLLHNIQHTYTLVTFDARWD